MVDTLGTSKIAEHRLNDVVRCVFAKNPDGIIHTLDLRKPIYRQTAAYGHFGRPEFAWEDTAVSNIIINGLPFI
jgi:S-adenosylmethionine synthetase